MIICIIRITTAYFSPAELKNLYITTSHGLTAYVTYCHAAGQTVALIANCPNCIFNYGLQWKLIMGTCTRVAIQQYKHVEDCPNCNCLIPIQSETLKQVESQAYINSQSHLNISNKS